MQLLQLLSAEYGNDSVSVVDCSLRLCSDTLNLGVVMIINFRLI